MSCRHPPADHRDGAAVLVEIEHERTEAFVGPVAMGLFESIPGDGISVDGDPGVERPAAHAAAGTTQQFRLVLSTVPPEQELLGVAVASLAVVFARELAGKRRLELPDHLQQRAPVDVERNMRVRITVIVQQLLAFDVEAIHACMHSMGAGFMSDDRATRARIPSFPPAAGTAASRDRKSTRLNSSH